MWYSCIDIWTDDQCVHKGTYLWVKDIIGQYISNSLQFPSRCVYTVFKFVYTCIYTSLLLWPFLNVFLASDLTWRDWAVIARLVFFFPGPCLSWWCWWFGLRTNPDEEMVTKGSPIQVQTIKLHRQWLKLAGFFRQWLRSKKHPTWKQLPSSCCWINYDALGDNFTSTLHTKDSKTYQSVDFSS